MKNRRLAYKNSNTEERNFRVSWHEGATSPVRGLAESSISLILDNLRRISGLFRFCGRYKGKDDRIPALLTEIRSWNRIYD